MASYFAQVFKEDDGGYFAEFPDLPGAVTQANTLEELDAMLKDALFVYLDACKELGDPIPEPSNFKSVMAMKSESGPVEAVVLVATPEKLKKERVNVMLHPHELAIIDAAANERHMNRSEFIVSVVLESIRASKPVTC